MKKYDYCPNCQIGLNSQEMTLRICKNCEHSWDEEDEHDTMYYTDIG